MENLYHQRAGLRVPLMVTLARYRLQFYALETGRALRRHWQLLLLVVGVLYKIIDFRWLARPVIGLAGDTVPSVGTISAIILYHVIGLVAITFQSRVVRGGAFGDFLQGLPFTTYQQHFLDITIIVVANNVLWGYLVLALVKAPYANLPVGGLLSLVALVTAMGAILIASQWIWFYDRLSAVSFLLVTDLLLFGGGLELDVSGRAIVNFGMAAAAALTAIWLVVSRGRIQLHGQVSIAVKTARIRRWVLHRLPAPMMLQVKLVFGEHGPEAVSRLTLAAAALTFGWAIVVYGGRASIAPTVLLVVSAAAAPILAGLYRMLLRAHDHASHFSRSLPIARHYWMVRDVLFLALLSTIVLVIFLLLLYLRGAMTGPQALLVLAANIVLITLLCVVSACGRQHTVIFSAVVVSAWTAFAILIVHRI